MSNVTLTFDDLNSGTVVDNEYQAEGVTIFSIVNGVTNPGNHPAMVFDTDNPTGGDTDLATSNLGNVLIVSEDGDSNDPDDNASGGVLCFDFDDTVTMDQLTLLDVEEGARIKLWDANGNVIYSCKYYTSDNGQQVVDFNGIDGVARMDIVFSGSGAVDNISYANNESDLDGTVEGTGGDDVIDVAYVGDPDGDQVDNNDAILPGDSGDDDLIEAYGGDDLVKAGAGNDEVYGGYGDDEIYTGSGDDTAFGENGADTLVGGSGDDELHGGSQNDVIIGDGADMESGVSYDGKVLVWDDVASDGTCLGSSTDHNVGGINVNIGFQSQDHGAFAKISNETVYVENGEGMDSDSSLKLYGQGGEGGWDNTSTTTLNFSATNGSYEDDVANVAFRIDDIDLSTTSDDHIDRVTVLAYDADGNAVEVTLTPELNGQTVNGNTATGTVEHNSGVYPSSQMGSVLVSIAGPVSKIVIDYDNGGGTDQQVNVTDVTFDALTVTDVPDGAAGSDVLYGDAGDDIIQGNDEDDTLYGGTGDDTLEGGADNDELHGDEGNDRLIGGDGDDDLSGGDGTDVILGGAGDDVADGGADRDEIWMGSGNDSVVGGDGNDWIHGQTGNDVLDGGDDDDMLFGEQGDDTLIGGAGADQIEGGDDADYIYGGAGDNVDGGTGGNDDDTLDLTGQGAFYIENETIDADGDSTSGTVVFVDGAGDPTGETLTFTEIEKIIGDEINRGPDAQDDTITVDEDSGATTIDVLANDSDPDGDDLTISSASVPADQGTVEIVSGKLVFTPAENFNGDATIIYTVDDGNGGTDTATVAVTVTPVNDDPIANDDSADTDEDTPVTIDVLDNDTDVDGDDLTISSASVPADQGTVEIVSGELVFTPAENFNGDATITYTVDDGNGGSDSATVTVNVGAVNDGPDAVDDSDTTDFNTAVTVDLLANDTDPEDDPLTVTDATLTQGEGDIVDNGDGTFTYTPDMGFSGEAVITYTISDGNGGTDTATHTITVGEAPLDGTVNGTDGADIIDGGYLGDPEGDRVDNNDALVGNVGSDDDIIEAYGGDDTVLAGAGDDTVYGGDGDDSILGQGGYDTLLGEDGDDTITGGKDDDVIYGGNDDDVLDGDSGDDSIEGNDGNDSILGGGGMDTIRGGTGDDTIDGENNDDMIFGGAGDDNLSGGASDDKIEGGSGDDVIDGGSGNDDLWGATGDDTVYGGTGNDTIATAEGNDVVEGGDGNDIIDTANDEDPLTGQNLPDQAYPGVYAADLDPNDDLDTVYGGAGNDTITTGDDNDVIYGGEGKDVIDAGIDDDYVEAGAGNDTVIGSEGNDEIYGEDGNDTIYGGLVTPGPADALNLPDDLDGNGDSNGPGEDLVTDNNNDTLFGGAGDDTIYGADDDDTLYGGTGDDLLDGGVDDDTIEGGEGEDVIIGGQGNDDLSGGLGSDTFLGGNGGDTVVGGEDPDDSDVDVLDLSGSDVDFITYVDGDPEAGTVTFLDGSTMTFSEIENVIPCFTPGTTIATPKGERLVEELREGDRIITRDNGIQEIRWMGRKEMSGKQLVKNPHLKPILVKAGSLGNGLPERDMLVSPNHRMLVASDKTQLYFEEREVLAAAKHLVGSQGIHTVDVMQTTYIHFMFDRHEVVLSNGAWTESFQPGDYSLKGIGNSQRQEIFELFPELQSKVGLEGYQSARRALKKHEARLLVK